MRPVLLALAVAIAAATLFTSAARAGGPVTFGDVNCTFSVNSIDAALVLQLDAGLTSDLPCIHNGDTNTDGRVNSVDAALILQFVAGLTEKLGNTVNVSLSEWAVRPNPTRASSGNIAFRLANDGTVPHEFHVIRTDLPAGSLPMTESGTQVDESAVDVVASFGSISAGDDATLTISPLEADRYVLICNIPSHYENGMFTTFFAD